MKTTMLVKNKTFQDYETLTKNFKMEKKVKYLGVTMRNTNSKFFQTLYLYGMIYIKKPIKMGQLAIIFSG